VPPLKGGTFCFPVVSSGGAVDLKFLSMLRQARYRNFKFKDRTEDQ
jgi:hypothetical protein